MKKIIRLTESDLTRIVKRVIRESDGERESAQEDPHSGYFDSPRMYDHFNQSEKNDMGKDELEHLIRDARDILETECGYDLHDINLMDENDIIDALYDNGFDDAAEEIEDLLYPGGFEDDYDDYDDKFDKESQEIKRIERDNRGK